VESIHQRVPLAIGSRSEVDRYTQFLNTGEAPCS